MLYPPLQALQNMLLENTFFFKKLSDWPHIPNPNKRRPERGVGTAGILTFDKRQFSGLERFAFPHAFLNIFVKKKKILASLALIIACGLLVYFIKVYILLVLVLSLLIWQFAEFNKLIENKTLQRIFAGMTFAGSLLIGLLLLNYLTSTEAGQQYQLDKIAGNAEHIPARHQLHIQRLL